MGFIAGPLLISTAISAALSGASFGLSLLLRKSYSAPEGDATSYELPEGGEPINIAYGRCGVPALVAYTHERDPNSLGSNRTTVRDAINNTSKYEYGWLTFKPRSRKSPVKLDGIDERDDFKTKHIREYQMSQHVFAVTHSGAHDIQTLLVDGRTKEDPTKWVAFAAKIDTPGTANAEMTLWSPLRDSTAKFTNLQYATVMAHHVLQNPVWAAHPNLRAFGEWEKLHTIELNSGVYSVSSARTYDNNAIKVLYDYTAHDSSDTRGPLFGPAIPADEINLESFYDAQQYFGEIVQGVGNVLWNLDYPEICNNRYGTNYDKWSDAFKDELGSTATITTTGLGGGPSSTKETYYTTLPTTIKRGEYNGLIPTHRRFVDIIETIRETCFGLAIFRDHEGKIKLSYPPSSSKMQSNETLDQFMERISVGTITTDNLLGADGVGVSFPSEEIRPNQLDVSYFAAANGGGVEHLIFPVTGSNLHNSLLVEDSDVHRRLSITLEGVNNVFAAKAIAANMLLTARQPQYAIECTQECGLYELNDVVKLEDTTSGVFTYGLVVEKKIDYLNNIVRLSITKYHPCDYDWNIHAEEFTAPKVTFPILLAPTNVVLDSSDPASGLLTCTWDDPNEDEDVSFYDVAISRDDGANYEPHVRLGNEAREYNIPWPGKSTTFKVRVRCVAENGLTSVWVESNSASSDPNYIKLPWDGNIVLSTKRSSIAEIADDLEWHWSGAEDAWPESVSLTVGVGTTSTSFKISAIREGSSLTIECEGDNYALYKVTSRNRTVYEYGELSTFPLTLVSSSGTPVFDDTVTLRNSTRLQVLPIQCYGAVIFTPGTNTNTPTFERR